MSVGLPAALRCVGALTGARDVRDEWDDDQAEAWRRAVCAAADAFAEYGEGHVGGFSIGSFSVTNYRDEGTTGAEVAREAALAELAGYTFGGCGSLVTIWADADWALPSSGVSGFQTFYQCASLVGEAGTTYASSRAGYQYMRIGGVGGARGGVKRPL